VTHTNLHDCCTVEYGFVLIVAICSYVCSIKYYNTVFTCSIVLLFIYFCFIIFCVRCSRGKIYSGYGHLSVSLSVCLLPHFHATAQTWMSVGGMVGGNLWLCTIERICNRCTGFVAMTRVVEPLNC